MRSIIYYLFVCTLFFTACNNSGSNQESKTDNTKTVAPVVDSFALARAGVYQGYLPCADCRGISTFLQLKEDMTYRLEETYHKKVDSLNITNGTWKTNNGKIVLTAGDEILNSYLPEGEKLWQLDYRGNRISGNLGDRYMLTRQQQANNSHLKEKADAGIDFVANGNEPFWSLEIDKGKIFIFNRPGLESPDSIAYAEPVMTNGIREYHVESAAKMLDVKISPRFCSDGMSDFIYEYKVELQYNKKQYSGCGRLIGSL